AFAAQLYHMTQRGARVLVMHDEVAPAPFESAHLFTKPRPADKVSALVAPAVAAAAEAAPVIVTAETPTPNLMNDAAAAPHGAAAPAQQQPARDKAKDAAPDAARNSAAKDTVRKADAQPAPKPVSETAASQGAAPQPAAPRTAAVADTKHGEAVTGTVLV